jgi:hypothetical protein
MAVDIEVVGNSMVVRWGDPTLEDVARIAQTGTRLHAKSGVPIIFVAWVPPDAPPPGPAVRVAMKATQARFLDLIAEVHAVLEGEGFFITVKRSILLGITLAVFRRNTHFVHATTQALLERVAPAHRDDVQAAVAALSIRARASAPPIAPSRVA